MRLKAFVVCAALCLVAAFASAFTSANLQGSRETVTSGNGDYIVSLLPSGVYAVTFELSGFGPQTRSVPVAPTQVVPLEVEMGADAREHAGPVCRT